MSRPRDMSKSQKISPILICHLRNKMGTNWHPLRMFGIFWVEFSRFHLHQVKGREMMGEKKTALNPQPATLPSARSAAKALAVALTCCTLWSWSRTAELSPPASGSPQVTTVPSSLVAAKAPVVPNAELVPAMWRTSLNSSKTSVQSPPASGSPQATTLPSTSAAKALSVDTSCCTSLSWSCTSVQSPPASGSPQVATLPSSKIAAKARLLATTRCTLLSRCCTAVLSPPAEAMPQVITPSSATAAKAKFVACSCFTCVQEWGIPWDSPCC